MITMTLLFLTFCALGGAALVYIGASAVYLAGVIVFNVVCLGAKMVLGLGKGFLIAGVLLAVLMLKIFSAMIAGAVTVAAALFLVWLFSLVLRGGRKPATSHAGYGAGPALESCGRNPASPAEERICNLRNRFDRYEQRLNRMDQQIMDRWRTESAR